MTPYESGSTNPFHRSGNGSAFDLMGINPSLFGGATIGNPGTQMGPQNAGTNPFNQQQGYGQPQGQQSWPQQPWNLQPNPYWQQNPWLQSQPFAAQSQPYPWIQQPQPFTQPFPQQQTPNVLTHKAVDVELTIPAYRVLGRQPQEIHSYLLHVLLPTLMDGLLRRAIHQDVGQTVSYDLRGECVARIGI